MSGSRAAPRPTGRRATRSRLDVTTVLAVVLPLVAVGALALVDPDDRSEAGGPPERTELTRSTLVCGGGGGRALLAGVGDEAGEVTVRAIGRDTGAERQVGLQPGRTTEVATDGPVAVTGEDGLAPGLVGVVTGEPLAAAGCREPVPDRWFTGVGAAARHSSVLELVNPDGGPAVADAIVYGSGGPVDVPELRGVAVPPHGVVRIDLARTVPRRDELTLRVTTSRGRVAAAVRDRYDQLGAGPTAEDWLPAQLEPATTNLLLGPAEGDGQRSLVLANAGEDEARAQVRVVTPTSVFAPEGVEDVVVAPGSVERVTLTRLLRQEVLRDAIGIVVDSSAPLTATFRSFVDGDLSSTVGGARVTSAAAAVPPGEKRLLLAGADRAGSVAVTARDAAGEVVAEEQLDVAPGSGAALALPAGATLVEVRSGGVPVAGAVLVDDGGAAVLGLPPLVLSGLVADVRPGLR